ncbi:MAG TPA: hypothetical protein VM370_08010 [Candidatus Thermoplasmatota archaeon]|nr:hypothetical protein [Candidatus Thermoplasmatota archaeon]
MPLGDAAAVFSGILVLGFGLTILFCGMFTTYFGAGKSRKVGMGLVIVGLLTLFAWITITFGVNVFGTIDAWNAQQMATGIAGVAAGLLGGLVALALFLVAIMRA